MRRRGCGTDTFTDTTPTDSTSDLLNSDTEPSTNSETGKETTFHSTGDATGFVLQVASRIFKDYMKCDIINVNHHGFGTKGGNDEMAAAFKLVSPTLLLWPIGINGGSNAAINQVDQHAYNRVLFENASYKEVYYEGDRGGRDVVVPLPYVVGNIIEVKH